MAFKIDKHTELTEVTTEQDVSLGIMKWGKTNAFPQSLINLINKSPLAKAAVSRTAKFYRGRGFEGDISIVGQNGLTLGNVVKILAEDYATYSAFALHFNYNIKGQITTIQPMRIAELRFNEFDELNYANKIGYHPNFARNSEIKKNVEKVITKENIKWFNRFNPDPEVIKQQYEECEGIDNYLGQIFYYTDSGKSSYPIPPLQSCINHVLSDIDSSTLVRRETATGFHSTMLLKTSLQRESQEFQDLESSIHSTQGVGSSNKVISATGLSPEEVNGTMFEEMGSGGAGKKTVMETVLLTNDLNKKIINGAYLIPPVLAGSDQKNGFGGTNLEDAYWIFNSITVEGRDAIQDTINSILPYSIHKGIGSIEIDPLSLLERPNKEIDEKEIIETPKTKEKEMIEDNVKKETGKKVEEKKLYNENK